MVNTEKRFGSIKLKKKYHIHCLFNMLQEIGSVVKPYDFKSNVKILRNILFFYAIMSLKIIQKRYDDSVNFQRTWIECEHGFGDVNGEYWLGRFT